MEFFDVQTGCTIGALKAALLEPTPSGWMILLRDEDDCLLPLTCDGQVQTFPRAEVAAALVHQLGVDRIWVMRDLSPRTREPGSNLSKAPPAQIHSPFFGSWRRSG